jgi:hypothetical protein
VTSTPPPPPPQRPVGQLIAPLRDLAAYAFVAAPAVWIFVAVIRLIPSGDGQNFLTRVQNSFYSFVNVEIIVLPIAAVLLTTLIKPVPRHARLITIAALIEYATAGFFAVLFGFLIGLMNIAGWSVRVAFEEFLVRTAWLAVFAVAAYAVFLIWRSLYHVPAPKPVPGVYGQPQPQWQQPGQAHPGQAYPGQPQPGQPQQGPGQSPAAQWGPPPAPGQSYASPPAWGAPATAQPSAPPAHPVSAQPASPAPGNPPGPYAPQPGHPAAGGYAGPAQPSDYADPTRPIPSHDANDDRTRVVGEEPPHRQ